MKTKLFPLLLVVLAGCAPSAPEPKFVRMGDSAPTMGATPIDQFLVGSWTTRDYIDPSFAQQLGVSSIANQQEEESTSGPITEVYEFKAGGTFEFHFLAQRTDVGGTWTVSQNTVTLNYTTLNGKPIEEEKARLLKEAETGRQGAVRNELITDFLVSAQTKLVTLAPASDPKLLMFTSSMPNPADAGAGGTVLAGTALMRLKKE